MNEESGVDADPMREATQRFRDAEEALREVIAAAESLRSVRDDMADASRALGAGERSLRDSGDAVYQLASEMKAIARDLAAGVDILKSTRVAEIGSRQEAMQMEQRRVVGRVNLAVAMAGLGALLAAVSAVLTLVQ
jgi:hypothetical protein